MAEKAWPRAHHWRGGRRPQRDIQNPHRERHPVRIRRLVSNQRFADIKPGGFAKKTETALDAARGHIDQRVVRQIPDGRAYQRDRQKLVDQAAKRAATP